MFDDMFGGIVMNKWENCEKGKEVKWERNREVSNGVGGFACRFWCFRMVKKWRSGVQW